MGKNVLPVNLTNNTGQVIVDVNFLHRYDNDANDPGFLHSLDNNAQKPICQATFWTGFLRTGYDYWWVQFSMGGQIYTCKTNFYCYLTSDDADSGKAVNITLTSSKMIVTPPVSSGCTVSLYTISEAHEAVAASLSQAAK